jgi:hypothetical protein
VKQARVKQGRVLVVPQLYPGGGGGGWGCISTLLSLPLLLPALSLSLPESRVWALQVTCGPRTTRRRVRPALGPGCAGSSLLCGAVDPCALGWHGVCAPCASSALTSCRGPGGV